MTGAPAIDPEALLCALVIAPEVWSRNRHFKLFEQARLRQVRRRAGRVRTVVRQLAGQHRPRAEVVGEQVRLDGSLLLRYRVPELAYERAAAFSPIEAAALRYALHRAGAGPLDDEDRRRVEGALERLTSGLELMDRGRLTPDA
ncbi:MAG: hypothetical protein OZ921_01355 [Sorangiineae bacterium]|nr:hypothetical protein [Polyangiaceae bacterium]MEB2321131.1 hypothetical protein [Sorangiineae bacterium]